MASIGNDPCGRVFAFLKCFEHLSQKRNQIAPMCGDEVGRQAFDVGSDIVSTRWTLDSFLERPDDTGRRKLGQLATDPMQFGQRFGSI